MPIWMLCPCTRIELIEQAKGVPWDDLGMGGPTGTLTFLFTDVEGSTRRWQEDEEAMSEALARHDELLRCAVEAHGGTVFSTMGDGIAAVFLTGSEAVAAALDAQEALAAVLPVRMGIHTGEAEFPRWGLLRHHGEPLREADGGCPRRTSGRIGSHGDGRARRAGRRGRARRSGRSPLA